MNLNNIIIRLYAFQSQPEKKLRLPCLMFPSIRTIEILTNFH